MSEFTILITHTTTGKEITLAVEPQFTINEVLQVLAENLQLKDRFVLATPDNKILSPEATLKDMGLKEGDALMLMPDPTGGRRRLLLVPSTPKANPSTGGQPIYKSCSNRR